MKKCTKCKRWKKRSAFCKDSGAPDRLFSWCRLCVRNNHKKYLKTPEYRRNYLRRLYSTTPEEITELLVKQGHRCSICRAKLGRGYHIDHDHETGKVRGLLCGVHNQGLGLFQHDPKTLRAAAEYLESHG